MERNKHQGQPIIADLTWNDQGWRNIYVNPHAGHKYAKKHPGHESLNFEFNKPGLDTEKKVFGFFQWTKTPTERKIPAIFFYTKNLNKNRNEIVGVYGNSEILDPPRKTKWNGFEKNILESNIVADKELSLLFPISLDSRKYSSGKRLVPRAGFTYVDSVLAEMMIIDEIEALKSSGIMKEEYEKLTRVFEHVTGKKFDMENIEYNDINGKELDDLTDKMSHETFSQSKRKEMINELNSLTPESPETVEYKGRVYKRNNKTIAQLKILRNFKCQICNNSILKKDGSHYVEAAHIQRKSQKGTEMPNNILILCPNHHKEFDLGDRKIIERTDQGIVFEINGKHYDLSLSLA